MSFKRCAANVRRRTTLLLSQQVPISPTGRAGERRKREAHGTINIEKSFRSTKGRTTLHRENRLRIRVAFLTLTVSYFVFGFMHSQSGLLLESSLIVKT